MTSLSQQFYFKRDSIIKWKHLNLINKLSKSESVDSYPMVYFALIISEVSMKKGKMFEHYITEILKFTR